MTNRWGSAPGSWYHTVFWTTVLSGQSSWMTKMYNGEWRPTCRRCGSPSGCRQHHWRNAAVHSRTATPPLEPFHSHNAQEQWGHWERRGTGTGHECLSVEWASVLLGVPFTVVWQSFTKPEHREGPVPEGSQQWSVDGVSVVDIEMIPAALSGKVIEPQPQNGVGSERVKIHVYPLLCSLHKQNWTIWPSQHQLAHYSLPNSPIRLVTGFQQTSNNNVIPGTQRWPCDKHSWRPLTYVLTARP